MKLNTKVDVIYTHEGGTAKHINAEQELRRSVMTCLLWENNFYESGVSIADRITSLIPMVNPHKVCDIAIEARTKSNLRHVPLLIAAEMARHKTHRIYLDILLPSIIRRADELAEFLSIYWKDGKTPICKKVKQGLAASFLKFDAYQFAKYNRDAKIKLRDVMFMVHPKPITPEQEVLFKQISEDKLPTPDTWEVVLSSTSDKCSAWTRLIVEKKLGALAFLRNLRNMREAGVSEIAIIEGLKNLNVDRVLPFRFIAASKYAPQWESYLESAMMKCLIGSEQLPGKTVLLVDVSGSMQGNISEKSDITREDAANGLSILIRELCERVTVYSFSDGLAIIPDRRGFALRDAIHNSQAHRSTQLGAAVRKINEIEKYDRLIVMTDEQSSDIVPDPNGAGYIINVSSNKNGVGYGAWQHIDGWSENCMTYIIETEKQ